MGRVTLTIYHLYIVSYKQENNGMNYRELKGKNGVQVRQLSGKVIAIVKPINDDTFRVYGFEVVDYEHHEPKTLRLQNSYTTKSMGDWGTVYYKLFGKPSGTINV